MQFFNRISSVARITCLTLGVLFSTHAAASIVTLPNLNVRVFSTDNFSAYLILEGIGTKVIVTCNDDPSKAQSLIHIVQDDNGSFSSTLFSGPDFYCYGALAVARELKVGDTGALTIETQSTPTGELVTNVELKLSNRSQLNRFEHSKTQSTNWIKR